jgi:hypothetical protein
MVNEAQTHPEVSKTALQYIVQGFGNSDGVKDASSYVTKQASSGIVRSLASVIPFASLVPEGMISGASDGLASMTQQVVENTPQGRESLGWINRKWQDLVLTIGSWLNKDNKLEGVVDRYSQDNKPLDKPLTDIAHSFNAAYGKQVLSAGLLKDAVTAGVSDNIGILKIFSNSSPQNLAESVYKKTIESVSSQLIQGLNADKRDDPEEKLKAHLQAEQVAALVSGVRAVDAKDKKPVFAPVLDENGKPSGALAYFTESFAGKQPQAFAVAMPKQETPKPDATVNPARDVAQGLGAGTRPVTPVDGARAAVDIDPPMYGNNDLPARNVPEIAARQP